MRIAILTTCTEAGSADRWRDLLASKRPHWDFVSYHVPNDEFPPRPQRFDGWMVTGSPQAERQHAPWQTRLKMLVADIAASRKPMFGAGSGHQLVAVALGGKVGPNPDGPALGAIEVEACARPPWMEARRFWQYGHHAEQVTTPPPDAEIVLRADHCPVAGLTIGDHIFTTQNHPEMTHEFIAELIETLAPRLPDKVIDRARASLPLSADNGLFSDCILRFFEHDRSA